MASEKQELEKKLKDTQGKVEEQDEMLKFCLTLAEVKKNATLTGTVPSGNQKLFHSLNHKLDSWCT